MKLTDRTRDLILRWLLLAAYAAATLALTLCHEPKADELQAWLIARDCTVPEIFAAMKWEGHFVPWYLMLHVFAANGAPVLCMNLLSWAFLTAAGAFFLFRAPFTLPMKALALCSSGMLFWYPVVARCYAPIPILLFLLASLWSRRLARPLLFGLLIALLTNTHAFFEGFCGIVFVLCAYDAWKLRRELPRREIRRIAAGLCIAAAGALFAFAQVAPGLFSRAQSVGNQRFWPMRMTFYERLATSFVDFAGCTKEVANVEIPVLEYLWAALLLLLIAWLVRRWRTGLLYLTFAAVFFGAFWFALPKQDQPSPLNSGFQLVLDFIVLPFIAIALLSMFRASRRMGVVLLTSFLWMILFAMFLFYFLPQRALLLFLAFVFCHWVLLENPSEWNAAAPGRFFLFRDGSKPLSGKRRLAEILAVYICFTVPGSVSFAMLDFRQPFSGAKEMGEYLTKNLPPGSTVFLPFYGITDTVISAYAPGLKFYCVESGKYITFCPLDWTQRKLIRKHAMVLPKWSTDVQDGQLIYTDMNGFMASPLWDPVIHAPGPHYFVCDMWFLGGLHVESMKLRSKDRKFLFTEKHRTQTIPFTASAGEQYWLFTDEAVPADEFLTAVPGTF